MFSSLSDNLKGMILAFIGFSCFAVADANAKLLTDTYSAAHIVGIVAIFSTVLSVCFATFLGGLRRTLRTKKLKIHLARGLANALTALCIVFSLSKLTIAGTYSMLFVAPFVISMLAIPIFGEKVSRHGWIAIIGGFIGVLIVVRPGVADVNPYLLVPLFTTVLIAALFMLARPLDEEETLISRSFYPVVTNFILITPLILYLYGWPAASDLIYFVVQAVLIVAALITTALAFRMAKASLVSPFLYSEIIWAIGFDYFIFEEIPGLWTMLGCAVIIISGLYLIFKERHS